VRRFFDRVLNLFDWLDGIELVIVAGVAALLVVLGPLLVVYRFVFARHYVVASALMLVWSVCIAACVRDLRRQAFTWVSAIAVGVWGVTTVILGFGIK